MKHGTDTFVSCNIPAKVQTEVVKLIQLSVENAEGYGINLTGEEISNFSRTTFQSVNKCRTQIRYNTVLSVVFYFEALINVDQEFPLKETDSISDESKRSLLVKIFCRHSVIMQVVLQPQLLTEPCPILWSFLPFLLANHCSSMNHVGFK